MQTPARPTRRIETELDALLLHIEAIALTCARALDAKQAVDIAHDVVLACLIRIRKGSWAVAPDDVPRFIRRMVQSRGRDLARGRDRSDERDGGYAEKLEEAKQGWNAPDQLTEARELDGVHERAISALPAGCRRAYLMVRDSHESYAAVGKRLGISESAVCGHMVKAKRHLRKQLLACGIAVPPPRRGPASRRADSRPRDVGGDHMTLT